VKPRDDLGISSETVLPVFTALRELGFDAASAIGELSSPFFSGSVADAMLELAADRLGEPALGLALAKRIPIGALGTLDYAFVSSATLRAALDRAARYYGLTTQRLSLENRVEPPYAHAVLVRNPDAKHSRHAVEFALGLMAERIRQVVGRRIAFHEVAFAHDPPADSSGHQDFFGMPVLFSQELDRLVFAQALLDSPLRTAQASLSALLEERMSELEPPFPEGDAFLQRVHRAVFDALDEGKVDMGSAVVRLELTRRTPQRELQKRGTSHTQILDAVRRERAQHLLSEGHLTVAEVSKRLGFSEPSAFFRAFRRWTGTSPKAAIARMG
jgi:AraC-like DNA-binding protein